MHFPVVKFLNRVLSDYPAARARLELHQGKLIDAHVGPFSTRMRVSTRGELELAGSTGDADSEGVADVSFTVPLSMLPRLASKEADAFSQIVFAGDSELAATLSDIVRNVEWDVEADLSRVVGDVAAHRIVGAARGADAWRLQSGERLRANVVEYLTEERQAFIATQDLEALAKQNESLRDEIARLDARLAKVMAP
jgi:ubiquinone biosynthesis protein UbiJ